MKHLQTVLIAFGFFVALSASPVSADAPHRIISLAPNITEILFALGLGDRIVGVTTYCDFPEEARRKAKVGGMSNPSLESVLSLNPDMVILTTDGNPKHFSDRLSSFRIKTHIFRARTLRELPHGIRALGAALGAQERADRLAEEIRTSLTDPVASMPHAAHRKKVLFIIWPEPLIVAGPGTAIDEAITMLGHRNIAAESASPYPKFSIESVIRQSPDVILIGKGHTDMQELSGDLLKRLAGVSAVKNRRVFFVSDTLYRLGPRVIEGIREMSACLQ